MENLTLDHLVRSLYYTIVTDKNGKITYISDDYCKLLELTIEQIVGRYVRDIIPNSQIPEVLQSQNQDIGSLFVMTNGETVVCNRIPVKIGGKLAGVISTATFHDMQQVQQLNDTISALRDENHLIKKQLESLQVSITPPLVGNSKSMQNVREMIEKVTSFDYTVLLCGETGTGKEVAANEIHRLSQNRLGPFVKINCAAIPGELLESELFGYKAGAFSGANPKGMKGKFEMANHGTILLDEISEIPLSLQAKLLRVIQEKEITPIGCNKPLRLDVRILCSSNRDLFRYVEQGHFREDLFYRINVMEINLPPLRERKEDILPLSKHFIGQINRKNGLALTGLTDEVQTLMQEYDWPGNVRELRHVLERASILRSSWDITLQNLEFLTERKKSRAAKIDAASHSASLPIRTLSEVGLEAEKETILYALEVTGGNKSAAASLLGIDRSSLYTKLRRHKLSQYKTLPLEQ